MTTQTKGNLEMTPERNDRSRRGRRCKRLDLHGAGAALVLAFGAGAPTAPAQGPLVSWGLDNYGQVSETPAGTFVAVAASSSYGVAIRPDGTLVSWGDNAPVVPAGTFTAVVANTSVDGYVAIRSDGTLADFALAWTGDTPAGTFSAVAVDESAGVAIRTDGTLVSWGFDPEWGDPAPSPPAGTYSDVALSWKYGVGIRTDGTLVSWGEGIFGQPAPPPPAGTHVDVALILDQGVAIRTDGSLVSWSVDTASLPWTPPAGTFTAVAGGYDHFVAIRTDGTLVAWGLDWHGQVSDTPGGTFSAVSTGPYFSAAISGAGNEPPVIECHDPVVLWSPGHDLVDASSAITVNDPDGDPVALTFRVFSDETEIPDTGDGTGNHAPDFKDELYPDGRGLLVRSERRASEDGRFYILVVTADDGNGGVTTGVCPIAVCPHDQTDESLADVLAQADAAAATILGQVNAGTLPASPGAPAGVSEHGLSEPMGPNQ